MTMALSHARRHRHPSVPVMVTVVVVVFGALAMLSVLAERNSGAGSSTDGRAAAAKALLAYEDAIYPAAQQAGEAIVAGIRPDIEDFRLGRISVAVWGLDMQTRQRELADARADFDRAAAPAAVKDAPARFAEAFDYYQQAVSLLLEAGEVSGQARTALIIRAGSIGDAGDTAFDRGTARVQAARRALGLGVDPRFSDVPTGTTRDSR